MKYFYCISTAGGAALHEVQGIDLGPSYRCPAAAWTLALFMQLVVMSEEQRVVFLLLQVCSLPAKKNTKAVNGEKLNVDAVVHRTCFERK